MKPIQAVPTPITPYVAPIKKKLLLYAVRPVEKREHTQNTKTLMALLLFSLLMTATTAKERFKTKLTKPSLSENQCKLKASPMRQNRAALLLRLYVTEVTKKVSVK